MGAPDSTKTAKKHDPLSIHLTARDMKKSCAYWRDVLGFSMDESWPDPNTPKWASFSMGAQTVMLGTLCDEAMAKEFKMTAEEVADVRRQNDASKKNQYGVGTSIYVMVPDVDAHYAKVKAKDGRILWSPQTRFYGLREFGVEDPDGYRVLFYTPTPGACGQP
jgi:uncharacterized glyoxalase superfamily protein PhnB